MRRAMRHAHILGAAEPLIHRLVPALVAEMGAAYPELVRAQPLIEETLKLEETKFRQTLDKGLRLLEEATATMKAGDTLPGDVRSEEHTPEPQSLMRISYAVFCLNKQKNNN